MISSRLVAAAPGEALGPLSGLTPIQWALLGLVLVLAAVFIARRVISCLLVLIVLLAVLGVAWYLVAGSPA